MCAQEIQGEREREREIERERERERWLMADDSSQNNKQHTTRKIARERERQRERKRESQREGREGETGEGPGGGGILYNPSGHNPRITVGLETWTPRIVPYV